MIRLGGWFWYVSEDEKMLEKEKCGKWMYFLQIKRLRSRYAKKQ